jgi:acetyl-CoA carboxylase/biotin carboxylase 1
MAATKSIISMRQWAYMELGDERAIQFVAMATAEDLKANAEFIRLADSFVEVPLERIAITTPMLTSLSRLP